MNTRKRVILGIVAIVLIALMLLVNHGVLNINADILGYSVGYWLKDILMIPVIYSVGRSLFPKWQNKAFGSFIFGALCIVTYQFAVSGITGGWINLLYRLGALLIGGLIMWIFVRLFDL